MGGVRLDYVECCLELGEDEHLVTEREEAGEEVVVIDGFLEIILQPIDSKLGPCLV